AVSCLAALLCGMFPALRLSSGTPADFIRQAGAGAAAPRLRAGRLLVIAQVAISVPLLVGAVLFLRTIYNLASVDLGFEPRGVVVFKMDPGLNAYDAPRVTRLYERVLDRVQAVAGVRSVTLVENSLVSGWVSNTGFSVDGAPAKSMLMNRVGPAFFETFGLPIVAGRGLGLQDRAGSTRLAVIDQAGAREFFGTANPIGSHLQMSGRRGPEPDPIEVVGVVRDSKYDSVKKDVRPTLFLPYFQSRGQLTAMFVAVRTSEVAAMPERLRSA